MPDADATNEEFLALILAQEASYPTLGRSNIGGWHSRPDFLARPDGAESAPSDPVGQVSHCFDHHALQWGLSGWAPLAQLMFTF